MTRLVTVLVAALLGASVVHAEELLVLTEEFKPYQYEDENGRPTGFMVELVGALTRRGVQVRVLTNSLASNDVAAVHSGYRKYRDDLLREGAEIYELRPDSVMRGPRWRRTRCPTISTRTFRR